MPAGDHHHHWDSPEAPEAIPDSPRLTEEEEEVPEAEAGAGAEGGAKGGPAGAGAEGAGVPAEAS